MDPAEMIESRIEDAVWRALDAEWTPEQIRMAVIRAISDYVDG